MRSLLQAIHLRRTRPEGLNGGLLGPCQSKRQARNCCIIVAFGRLGFVVGFLLVTHLARNT